MVGQILIDSNPSNLQVKWANSRALGPFTNSTQEMELDSNIEWALHHLISHFLFCPPPPPSDHTKILNSNTDRNISDVTIILTS